MSAPTVRRLLTRLDSSDVVTEPLDLRIGWEILTASPFTAWLAREVETGSPDDPQLWRDWNLEPSDPDDSRDDLDRSPELPAEA